LIDQELKQSAEDHEKEFEEAVVDDKGRRIVPSAAFFFVALMFVALAALLVMFAATFMSVGSTPVGR